MALITRVYRSSDNSLVAEGTPQASAYAKFIDYLPAGQTTLAGEYYAQNHDDSGLEEDSIKVNLLPFTKKAQAPAPSDDVSATQSATSAESQAPASSSSASAESASSDSAQSASSFSSNTQI